MGRPELEAHEMSLEARHFLASTRISAKFMSPRRCCNRTISRKFITKWHGVPHQKDPQPSV